MPNYVVLENGIEHKLTDDELKVIKIALKVFNSCDLPICSVEREQEYMAALKNLQTLFLEHID